MSTPPPASSGNLQTSSQNANQLGWNALSQAQTGVKRSQTDVQTVMGALIKAYGGKDGGAFQSLLNEWSGQVDVITRKMQEMMDALTRTGQAQTKTQSEIEDLIVTAKKQHAQLGDDAYAAMLGKSS
ncbi:hypothetical protein [Streptomyces palmae]|uniref:Uncharacterized protein n=1 Tax=Streptomyces palmae TaxID=1701085 RepID=A0A4Z0H7J4_9ACTN|nr:hypothetical protein [Streptomyces palmae]TGB05606.1 hypothetical protein E4099_19240 [Streptomyces palmae]